MLGGWEGTGDIPEGKAELRVERVSSDRIWVFIQSIVCARTHMYVHLCVSVCSGVHMHLCKHICE